jgi:catechol 2,3-dioxygenase-like lactoylglutathione lyase family enzyme
VRPGDLDRSRRFYREVLGLAVYQGFGRQMTNIFFHPRITCACGTGSRCGAAMCRSRLPAPTAGRRPARHLLSSGQPAHH